MENWDECITWTDLNNFIKENSNLFHKEELDKLDEACLGKQLECMSFLEEKGSLKINEDIFIDMSKVDYEDGEDEEMDVDEDKLSEKEKNGEMKDMTTELWEREYKLYTEEEKRLLDDFIRNYSFS
ncbi:hypothetical protein HOLleu_28076 [Holothuria leucospilota]|uniref:Uncharacterized protein n=1 Tax=Holothuria leucospilota TaxID=206669 RepID=A0A9Q1BR71_HOLLE|nr:hypothetical protein HOLleu_28076 [Holothuria leucospilota]